MATPDSVWTEEFKQKIIHLLAQRGVNQPCPRCRNVKFVLVEGFSNMPLSPKSDSISLGGKQVPTILTFCGNCGFMSAFAALAIGLTNQDLESATGEIGVKAP